MGDVINFVLFFILICFPVSHCTNTSTVCYGSSGPRCTTHRLSCTSPLVIQIINTTYGYRPGCNYYIGLSSCINTTCCNEEPGDCFILFSSDEHQRVFGNCSGVEACEVRGLRRYNSTHTVCNGREVSAYSKVEYACVIKDSGVVGGVLGTLLIISVIINVGLVVYFTRKMKSLTSTPRENNYDGITNTGRDQTLPTYDALQVQSVASSDNDDKKKSDSIHTYYNTKGDSLSRDIDPYYVNMKKP